MLIFLQGAMAGSLALNQRFAEAVEDLVGEEQWRGLKKSKAFFIAESQFDEEVKRDFGGKLDEEYYLNFPTASLEDDPENGLESSTWRMTGYGSSYANSDDKEPAYFCIERT